LAIGSGDAAAEPPLQWCLRSSVGEAILVLATTNGGKIADRVPDRWWRSGSFLGPLDWAAVTQPDEEEPRTVLRNAKIEGPQDPSIDFVTEFTQ
jgi:hypothetical protein